MNILNKLAIKNLKLNKKRTIGTLIGIILSVALICAISSMVTSFQKTLIENAINETGYYHIMLSDVNDNNIKELENNRDIKTIDKVGKEGYAILNGSKNKYKPYLKLYSMDNNTFNDLKFKLIKGKFPTNNKEIVISNSIISNAKVNYKIGDNITIDIGERRTLDDYPLKPINPYNPEDEKLVNTNNYTFKIVGIMERADISFESYDDPGYTIITNDIDTKEKDVYISLKNPKEYKTSISELLGAKDYNEVEANEENLKYKGYFVNRELLRWEAFAFSDSTITMLYSVVSVLIFIILFTSIFCIRNSFAISTTEKIKMYGMLSSVGATKKQIKKSVIFEGIILGLIGIPLGVLLGLVAVFVLIKIVNALIGDFLLTNIDGIVFNISIMSILLAIILGVVIIYLSAISSAKRASRVSPIEQLRNSNDIKIKNGKLKTPKFISKLFKTGGVLAYKNLKRSKKKYRTTVISLTVSIFIFITMNSFITNSFKTMGDYYKDYDYNIKLNSVDDLSKDEIDKILELDNIENYSILYEGKHDDGMIYIKIKDIDKINQVKGMELSEDYYYDESGEAIHTGEKVEFLQILALDSKSFERYVNKIGLKYEDVNKSGILCDDYKYYDSSAKKEKIIRRYKYSKDDIIKGVYNGSEINIKVCEVSNIRPYGLENNYYQGGYLVVNIDEYKNISFIPKTITINSKDSYTLANNIKELNDSISVQNLDKQAKANKSMILVVSIFLYGFITVITLIGVTNIFNTITSNMELRQKEFAMLKSIGMTKKEFNRMINLETIFYSSKALFYGIILGLIGSFIMNKAFAVKLDKGIYIPIQPIIISIIFVFVLVFIIMKYSINKINKQNTIETIRKENI